MDLPIDKLFSPSDLQSLHGESPTPLYHQTYALLKKRILDGSIPFGTKMPTEQELAQAFSVSRITAKRAMDELAEESLVERRRGKGSHVTYKFEHEPVEAPLVGMLEKLANLGRRSRVKVLDLAEMSPPAHIRQALGLSDGEKAWKLVRVRSTEDGEPFAFYESWTSGIQTGFTRKNLEKNVRLEVIQENGISLAHVEQDIGAAAVSAEVAGHLDMAAGEPCLTLVRQSFTRDGKLVDLLHCQYNPKRFHYRMSLSMDDYISEDES